MTDFITIPGFSKLTRQQIFDKAVAHIGTTRVKSTRNGEAENLCVYSGSGCNAAPLIRADKREWADDVGSWSTLADARKVPSHNQSFISELQDAHDEAGKWTNNCGGFIAEWKLNMAALAQKYKLDTTALDAIPVS